MEGSRTMTYSDSDIQQDISAELKSELRLRDDDIAVGAACPSELRLGAAGRRVMVPDEALG